MPRTTTNPSELEAELRAALKLCQLQAKLMQDNGLSLSEPQDRFVHLPEVQKRTGLCKETIRIYEHAGRFPRRYRLGPRRVGWRESQIEAWMTERRYSLSRRSEDKTMTIRTDHAAS